MNVQHEQLKNLMVRDKLFLKQLYEGNDLEQKRRILNSASDSKVHSGNHWLVKPYLSLLKDNGLMEIPFSFN